MRRWLRTLTQGDYNENDWKLTLGAILCEKMRAAVYKKTGFRCSAGIAVNKMLAKLACGMSANESSDFRELFVFKFNIVFIYKVSTNLINKQFYR